METPTKVLLGLGIFFVAFAMLIGAKTALLNLLFICVLYLLSRPLRGIAGFVFQNKALLLVITGTLLGLALETLWYFGLSIENKPQRWVSLLDDLIRMFPVYLLLFLFLNLLIRAHPMTSLQAFAYGGVMGYAFYFVMEAAESGAPLLLLVPWELNNFFLNGFLIWFPLFISDNLEGGDRSMIGHVWVCALLLGATVLSIALSIVFLSAVGYTPVRIGP